MFAPNDSVPFLGVGSVVEFRNVAKVLAKGGVVREDRRETIISVEPREWRGIKEVVYSTDHVRTLTHTCLENRVEQETASVVVLVTPEPTLSETNRQDAAQAIADAFAPKPLSKEPIRTAAQAVDVAAGIAKPGFDVQAARFRAMNYARICLSGFDGTVRRSDGSTDSELIAGCRMLEATGECVYVKTDGGGWMATETLKRGLFRKADGRYHACAHWHPGCDETVYDEHGFAIETPEPFSDEVAVDSPDVFLPKINRQRVVEATKASLRASVERQEREAVEATAFRELVVMLGIDLADGHLRIGNRIYQPSLMPSVARAVEAMTAKAQAEAYDPFEGDERRAA